jgi:hypothetical protein
MRGQLVPAGVGRPAYSHKTETPSSGRTLKPMEFVGLCHRLPLAGGPVCFRAFEKGCGQEAFAVYRRPHSVCRRDVLTTVEQPEMSKWTVILLLVHGPFFELN